MLTAVGGFEDAALGVASIRMSERRDKHDVGVARIDADLGDRLRLLESDVGPALSAVGAPVHAIALHDITAKLRLTHSDVDDVGVRLGDGDRAH